MPLQKLLLEARILFNRTLFEFQIEIGTLSIFIFDRRILYFYCMRKIFLIALEIKNNILFVLKHASNFNSRESHFLFLLRT